MKRIKNIALALLSVTANSVAFTSSMAQAAPITIGAKCPDIPLDHIINFITPQAKISDFKGKLLILDFWATWCAPCVSMLPYEDTLQKKFDGRVQILPVTAQDIATVKKFLSGLKKYKKLSVASVTDDTVLSVIFPHREIPHYVWIDANQRVIAITGAEKITAAVIQLALDNKMAGVPVKADNFKIIDDSKPMFVTGNELITDTGTRIESITSNEVVYHSILTGYIDGFGCEQRSDSLKITCKNSSVGDLYRIAAGHYSLMNQELNSTIWETTNPLVKWITDSAGEAHSKSSAEIYQWMSKYTYCYELKYPAQMRNDKYDIMLHELNNYFGALYHITGQVENRRIKCLALVKTAGFATTATGATPMHYTTDQYHLSVSKATKNTFLGILSINLDTMPPLVDETGDTSRITLNLNCNTSNVQSINESLAPYGLQLIEKMCNKDMIVIKDDGSIANNQLNSAGNK